MEKFIEEQNVTPFSERFKTENDPRTRKLLTRLLPDAENKLAANLTLTKAIGGPSVDS